MQIALFLVSGRLDVTRPALALSAPAVTREVTVVYGGRELMEVTSVATGGTHLESVDAIEFLGGFQHLSHVADAVGGQLTVLDLEVDDCSEDGHY
jgi:hypothetical protein